MNQDIVKTLRNYEGEYNYPAGLLADAATEIERLRIRINTLEKRISDMSWELNPDRMGK